MNWYKVAKHIPEIKISPYGSEGFYLYVDGKEYFCKGRSQNGEFKLNNYLKHKKYDDFFKMIESWPCISTKEEENIKREEDMTAQEMIDISEPVQEQLKLF